MNDYSANQVAQSDKAYFSNLVTPITNIPYQHVYYGGGDDMYMGYGGGVGGDVFMESAPVAMGMESDMAFVDAVADEASGGMMEKSATTLESASSSSSLSASAPKAYVRTNFQ